MRSTTRRGARGAVTYIGTGTGTGCHGSPWAPRAAGTRGAGAGTAAGAVRGRAGASAYWSKTLSVLTISRRAGMRSGTP